MVARPALLALLALAGCAGDVDFEVRGKRSAESGPSAAGMVAPRPSADSAAKAAGELALLTWNIEWFQDPSRGPDDEPRQMQGVRDVLARTRPDLAGLQEIAVPARLRELLQDMPQYALAISSYEWPQQTALLYRPAQFELIAVSAIAGLDDAGRPPLQIELATADGSALTVIVLHAKAGADAASRQRRERFAAGLERHLDALGASARVIVLGDFNDGFTRSIADGLPSPYAGLAGGGSRYSAPTAVLEGGAEPSTVWGDTVDHVVLSNELAQRVEPSSVDVLRDELLARAPRFFDEVSDHAPVALRLGAR